MKEKIKNNLIKNTEHYTIEQLKKTRNILGVIGSIFFITLDLVCIFISIMIFTIVFIIHKCMEYKNEFIVKEVLENDNKSKKEVIPQYYENEFIIEDCELYKSNIEKIIKKEKENDNIDLYDGTTNSEIKEYDIDVGEIDDQPTPDVKLNYNKTKTTEYISVCLYHSDFDKYLKVGNIPKNEVEKIKPYLDKKILIWGSYVGGTFKTTGDDGKIKKYKKDIQIKLMIKIFEK